MREAVIRFIQAGPLPHYSDASLDEDKINYFDQLLSAIQRPVTFDEAKALMLQFPPETCYDLEWDLLKCIESVIGNDVTTEEYIAYLDGIVDTPQTDYWIKTLRVRAKNSLSEKN